jgi:hypothetical protein
MPTFDRLIIEDAIDRLDDKGIIVRQEPILDDWDADFGDIGFTYVVEYEEQYTSTTWGMFSAKGDGLVEQAFQFYRPLVERRTLTPEHALRHIQDYVVDLGHMEARDTAVRESIWGAVESLIAD